jgi:hypothetical protein
MKPNRFYSAKQEKKVAKKLGMKQTKNSGATAFDKGDVADDEFLIECKTLTKPQKSHSIKKEWLKKNEEETFARGKDFSVLAFDFGDGDNYYAMKENDFALMLEAWRYYKDNI